MATYTVLVSLWRDPNNVPHYRILSRQNWMAAYLGYTLWMNMLFCGWPIMVNDMHTRRSTCLHGVRGGRVHYTHAAVEASNDRGQSLVLGPVVKVENQRWGNCMPALGPQTGGCRPLSIFYEVWGVGTLDLNNQRCRNCVPMHPVAL